METETMIGKRTPPKAKPLAVQIKEAEQRAALDKIERAARFEAEQEESARNLRRAELAKVARVEKEKLDTERYAELVRRYVPYVPLVLVNMVAMVGQFSWALVHLSQFGKDASLVRVTAAVLFAATAESIALVLQYHANQALRNRDSATGLYLAAFGVAGLVASVNYSHYATPVRDHFFGHPTPTALIFTLCSVISPWLWRIDSRAKHREALKLAGEIDPRAVKLSAARKVWHPFWSIGVISLSAWTGETNPAKAVEDYEARKAARKAARDEARVAKQAERAESASKSPESSEAPEVQSAVKVPQRPSQPRVKPIEDITKDPRYIKGVEIYKLSKAGVGRPLSQRDLAEALGMKGRVIAARVIKDVENETKASNGHAINAVSPNP